MTPAAGWRTTEGDGIRRPVCAPVCLCVFVCVQSREREGKAATERGRRDLKKMMKMMGEKESARTLFNPRRHHVWVETFSTRFQLE